MMGYIVGSFEGMVVLVALIAATCVYMVNRKSADDYVIEKMKEQNKRDVEVGGLELRKVLEMKKIEQGLITSHSRTNGD